MSAKTDVRLTPRQRLGRGLTYTAVGPVDITRGSVVLGLQSLGAAGSQLRQRYEKARMARELRSAQDAVTRELAAAQEVVANLPQAIQDARKPRSNKRRWALVAVAGVATLGVGAVAFSIVRRSMQPEPSPLPPSVEVEPKP